MFLLNNASLSKIANLSAFKMLCNAKNYASIAILEMIGLAESWVAENSMGVANAAVLMQTSESFRKFLTKNL